MKIHCFDVEIAKKYGIASAVLLYNIYYWIEKNRANEKNFHDGYYWTFNSKKAFVELFPYLNARQIDYALKKLIDDGVLITGFYNEKAYDRTLWYAITKKGYCILQNCEMDFTKLSNGFYNIVEPIPNINKDINTNNIRERFTPPTIEEIEEYAKERNSNIGAKKFYDYYTADKDPKKHWTDSNGKKVKNWKQKFITWENHSEKPKNEFIRNNYTKTQINEFATNLDEVEI